MNLNFHEQESELEKAVQENNPNLNTSSGFGYTIKNYIVDTTAALSFYTPLMASIEYFGADMEPTEVLKSRTFAAAYHCIFMRPYGKFREWWAEKWKAGPESHPVKKFLVYTSAMVLVQTPSYSAILYLAGATPRQIAVALPMGLTLGALSGRPYGCQKGKRHHRSKTGGMLASLGRFPLDSQNFPRNR